jgi:glycosidase
VQDSLYTISGNVILPDFHAARELAHRMNESRDLLNKPEEAIRAAELNAMGLIDEVLHYVVDVYRRQTDAAVFTKALHAAEASVGAERVQQTLEAFTNRFPPLSVYRHETSSAEHLRGSTEGISHRELALEEMLLLWLANENPAFAPFRELFDDSELRANTAYDAVIASLRTHYADQPGVGPQGDSLFDVLRRPALEHPDSLAEQLRFVRERWGGLLGGYLLRLLTSLDFIREERRNAATGPAPGEVLHFAGYDEETERYSPDRVWMPQVILMAKNVLVWLDQLTRTYERPIRTLDQVPNEELDRLAGWGFTGLWLIGLWERSAASRRVKQLCGNPEAESSAYSLYDYDISRDLGGWEALTQLRQRCEARGIRLASDMVPNHTGIDSRWVHQHPEWYIQLDHSPFPAYSFTGESLSSDPRIGIFIEDHYFERTDAAVVFKRTDFATNKTRYIYHGNDGTHMPWNDTAQLDYLNPEAREAVIQTILHVARNFSIIRFDAAMTLAKKHFQRLWYPEPGTGGDIASRAEHGLTKEQFDRAMPVEFWREVVDRVADEVPDTLLLAEAFWLMEGYFVRTLGMHRVYNSAFMKMLKDEQNAEYRTTVKNTLEFDPQILKRFVNFMNNPDEDTAERQFGTGDKYIGVCTMMCTMPGLPMFGHGQIEGFTEKYGMEYRRAYLDERPDPQLIERHEREVFPLMKKRYLFAEVDHFALFDVHAPDGSINENVFAYVNGSEEERTLVLFNNAYERAEGTIHTSVPFAAADGDGKRTERRGVAEALGLQRREDRYCLLREQRTRLWFIRRSSDIWENGFRLTLDGYQCQVFLDIHEVVDDELGTYSKLHDGQGEHGFPDVERALREVFLEPLLATFRESVDTRMFTRLLTAYRKDAATKELLEDLKIRIHRFVSQAASFADGRADVEACVKAVRKCVEEALSLPAVRGEDGPKLSKRVAKDVDFVLEKLKTSDDSVVTLLAWALVAPLGVVCAEDGVADRSRAFLAEWLLGPELQRSFQAMGVAEPERAVRLVEVLVTHQDWLVQVADTRDPASKLLERLLSDEEVRSFIGENRYEDVLWFNKESFETLMWWLFLIALCGSLDSKAVGKDMGTVSTVVNRLLAAEKQSEYRVDAMVAALTEEAQSPPKGVKPSRSSRT